MPSPYGSELELPACEGQPLFTRAGHGPAMGHGLFADLRKNQ